MTVPFNAGEIFEMAGQIERNGAKFYRRAADVSGGEAAKDVLLGLATMEDGHEKVFTAMKAEVAARSRDAALFDPTGDAGQYLQALADGKVFDIRGDPSEFIQPGTTLEAIFHKAIGLEKDSIVFYLGIRRMVPPELGEAKIDDIVVEEMGHITLLSGKLAELTPGQA